METLTNPKCPECGSDRVCKDGVRYLFCDKTIQRWLCRECGYRFSNSNKASRRQYRCQLCALLEGAKKLDSSTKTKTVGGTKKKSIEAQIVNYLIRLKNEGRRETTIAARDLQLKRLINLGADLNEPESVKKAVASLDVSESYKLLLCIAYEDFLKANGLSWERPKCKQSEPLPFCPHESELDALIANCGKKTATILKLMKETAMRLGEAWLTEWTDFDKEKRTIICRNPEKHSRPRIFDNLSPELCLMLDDLLRNSQFIFTCNSKPLEKEDRKKHHRRLKRQKGLLWHQRKRTACKLKNKCIEKITYH
jgi:integrase